MTTLKEIIASTSAFLPLKIKSIEWINPVFNIIGEGWNFSTLSGWRIVNNGKLICGSEDRMADEAINQLSTLSIISIEIQSDHLPEDPVFKFENGYKLEIFSAMFFEPWVFRVPSKNAPLYVASPQEYIADHNNWKFEYIDAGFKLLTKTIKKMVRIKNLISTTLPLDIETIESNNSNLNIIGKGWNFSTTGNWRIIKNGKLVRGCFDDEVIEQLALLKASSIVSIEIQSNHFPEDPLFKFANGYELEVFSTTIVEPWIFRAPSGTVFVPPISKETILQIYDLPCLEHLREKIKSFEEGHLNFQNLVVSLESILNGRSWKDEFRTFWFDLEKTSNENEELAINATINNIKKLIDFKIHNKIGEELKLQLAKEYEIIRIARWAHDIHSSYSLDSSTNEILERLALMEDAPKFEFTEAELKLLAEKLIKDEANLLQQIMDLKSKGLI